MRTFATIGRITYLGAFLSAVYQIVTATSGQEGIEKAFELIPDLVVSDVMMVVF